MTGGTWRRFLRPIRLLKLLTHRSGPTTSHEESKLLALPTEILLQIVALLGKDSQRLLSVTCRQVRDIFTHHKVNLTIIKNDEKLRFLQLFEANEPQLIMCMQCGILYRWQAQKLWHYHCPRRCRVEHLRRWSNSYSRIPCQYDFRITEGLVDLILRAHEKGPQYGLPLSVISVRTGYFEGPSFQTEGRVNDGQLLFHLRGKVSSASAKTLTVIRSIDFLAIALCCHVNAGAARFWQDFNLKETTFRLLDKGKSEKVTHKCALCETDYVLTMKVSACLDFELILDVYRNYGRRPKTINRGDVPSHLRELRNPIAPEELAKRDLSSCFDRGETGSDRVFASGHRLPSWYLSGES